jgi:hypothetical protein
MIPDGAGGFAPTVGIYAEAGRLDEANEFLAALQAMELTNPDRMIHIDLALSFARLGRMDESLERVAKAIEERVGGVVFLRRGFQANALERDPRLDRMLEDIGL